MVVSKRCKICAVIDAENVPIGGEYFGKQIPQIIFKLSGVEIDLRKANDVLICQSCVIQLVYTDVVIEKLRNAVKRLKKNVRKTKPKSSKKTVDLNKSENVEQPPITIDEHKSGAASGCGGIPNDIELNTRKKIVRRKSVFPIESFPDTAHENKQKEKSISAEVSIKKSPAIKCKSIYSPTETEKKLSLITASIDRNTVKRSNTVSTGEETPMDLTVDEQDCGYTTNEVGINHVKEKTRTCILCGKIFHSKLSLRNHIETAHMGERLKACPHCSSEFRTQQKYDSHVFSEKCKSSNHPCQHLNCSKRFKTVHKMELHMQQKHSSQNELECE